jgi:hypothetical protein
MIITLPKRRYASDLIIVDEHFSREFYLALKEKAIYHEVIIVNGHENRLGLHKGMHDKEIRQKALDNGRAYVVSKNRYDEKDDGYGSYSPLIFLDLNCITETPEVVDFAVHKVLERIYNDGYTGYGEYLN